MSSATTANVIAIAALIVSGVSASFTYRQMHDALQPSLVFYTDANVDADAGIEILNAGPGVAIVEDTKYFVDKKQLRNVDAAMDSISATDVVYHTDWQRGESIPPNVKSWLVQVPHGKVSKHDFQRVVDFFSDKFAIEMRYCSADGNCWTKCSRMNMCSNSSRS